MTTKMRVIATLDERIDNARRQIQNSAASIRKTLDGVDEMVANDAGRLLNSLGELQGLAARYEAAIGAMFALCNVREEICDKDLSDNETE